MQIIFSDGKSGRQVRDFLRLGKELTPLQVGEVLEKLGFYQQLSLLRLIRLEKLGKVGRHLRELRVPVTQAQVRFLGVLCGEIFVPLHAIKKKTQRLLSRDIEIAEQRAGTFDCREILIQSDSLK